MHISRTHENEDDMIYPFLFARSWENVESVARLFSSIFDQRLANRSGRFEVVYDRLVNLAQIPPRIVVAVEAVQKKHVGQ